MNIIIAEKMPTKIIVIRKGVITSGDSIPVNKKIGNMKEIKSEIEVNILLYTNKLPLSFVVIVISAGRVKFMSPNIVNIVSKVNKTTIKLNKRAT